MMRRKRKICTFLGVLFLSQPKPARGVSVPRAARAHCCWHRYNLKQWSTLVSRCSHQPWVTVRQGPLHARSFSNLKPPTCPRHTQYFAIPAQLNLNRKDCSLPQELTELGPQRHPVDGERQQYTRHNGGCAGSSGITSVNEEITLLQTPLLHARFLVCVNRSSPHEFPATRETHHSVCTSNGLLSSM